MHSISRNSDKTSSCFLSKIVNSELTQDAYFPFSTDSHPFIVLKSNTFKDCQDSSIFQPRLTVVLTAPFWINRYLQNKGFLWFLKSLFRQKNYLNEPNDSTTQDASCRRCVIKLHFRQEPKRPDFNKIQKLFNSADKDFISKIAILSKRLWCSL